MSLQQKTNSFQRIERMDLKKIKGGHGIYRCYSGDDCVQDSPPPAPEPCPPNTLIVIDGVKICPN